MLSKVAQAAKIGDLKNRFLFMMGMFAVYVVGLHVPVPGIDHEKMDALLSQGQALRSRAERSGGSPSLRWGSCLTSTLPSLCRCW